MFAPVIGMVVAAFDVVVVLGIGVEGGIDLTGFVFGLKAAGLSLIIEIDFLLVLSFAYEAAGFDYKKSDTVKAEFAAFDLTVTDYLFDCIGC